MIYWRLSFLVQSLVSFVDVSYARECYECLSADGLSSPTGKECKGTSTASCSETSGFCVTLKGNKKNLKMSFCHEKGHGGIDSISKCENKHNWKPAVMPKWAVDFGDAHNDVLKGTEISVQSCCDSNKCNDATGGTVQPPSTSLECYECLSADGLSSPTGKECKGTSTATCSEASGFCVTLKGNKKNLKLSFCHKKGYGGIDSISKCQNKDTWKKQDLLPKWANDFGYANKDVLKDMEINVQSCCDSNKCNDATDGTVQPPSTSLECYECLSADGLSSPAGKECKGTSTATCSEASGFCVTLKGNRKNLKTSFCHKKGYGGIDSISKCENKDTWNSPLWLPTWVQEFGEKNKEVLKDAKMNSVSCCDSNKCNDATAGNSSNAQEFASCYRILSLALLAVLLSHL